MNSISYTLSRPEARIGIFGEGEILTVESSLPKLLYGNNLMPIIYPAEALSRLGDFVFTYVGGNIRDLCLMDCLRVDYCHNFLVGAALPNYVHTLSKVPFLKHRRTTDESGGVEWWNDNGRRTRAYDKYKEIFEVDKKHVAEARGKLRFELQIRKKSGYLQSRLKNKRLTLQDVLIPEIAYCCLVETLEKMCLGVGFVAQDDARAILDANFSLQKATRLLGFLRRLQTESFEDVRRKSSRSSYYSDKAALRALGLWPPSAGPVSLPALAMPPIETLLSAEPTPCDSTNAERAA